MRPGSELEYDVQGLYSKFSVQLGVEDENRAEGEYECVILGDGRELGRRTGIQRNGALTHAEFDITGVHRLVLRVEPTESRRRRGQSVAWVEARISR